LVVGDGKVTRLFASVAAEYDTVLPFFSRLAASIVAVLDLRPGMRVLDVGCGIGAITAEAIARGCEVCAIDAVPAMIGRLRARCPGADARVIDAHDLAFPDGAFDAAVAAFVMHLLDDPVRASREVQRTLAPGGWFAIALPGQANDAANGPDQIDALFAEYTRYLPAGGSIGQPLDSAALLAATGFTDITSTTVEMRMPVPDAEALWRWLHTHGTKAFLDDLPTDRRMEFHDELVRRVEAKGLTLRRISNVHIGRKRPSTTAAAAAWSGCSRP
jgi:ubiquinone/menaquinone biosynthesis C-methylase UbiE